MATQDFLLEIGCEELPPQTLRSLSMSLRAAIEAQLQKSDLSFNDIHAFATPRRLAVLASDLIDHQSPRLIERQGPSIKAAYDKNGTPTLACLGFARSCGVSTDQLTVKETPQGSWVICRIEQAGKKTIDLLPDIVNTALKQLPITKPMRWSNHSWVFIRPVHWIVMMYGKDIVPATVLGQPAGRETIGHRFHHPKKILITQPKDYQQLLMTHGMVVADFEKRREKIRAQIEKAAAKVGRATIDEDLLSEVTSMVEWPVALLGSFRAEFLELPPEVLITSMKIHQRCFAVQNNKGELLPNFILVSNIESKDEQHVIKGNERVINARLADASFFYDNDLNTPLEKQLKKLEGVVFQHELSTVADKVKRLAKLTGSIADQLGEDGDVAKRAALLSKGDLVSEMVYEFPSLQGVMGYYYARHDKEPTAVAQAIREQYQPRFAGDELPHTPIACALSCADRLDTIVGILGINKTPTGDKDPFALRRAALGILRILIEKQLPLDLFELLKEARKNYQISLPNKDVVDQAFAFIMDRLRAWYSEKGIAANVFSAVLARKPTQPLDFDLRIKAVQHFQQLPQAEALAAANKRVSNILRKEAKDFSEKKIDSALFENEAERNLAKLLNNQAKSVEALYEQSDYTRALSDLATLKEPIDTFFDTVMVMVDDQKIRNNRLALLSSLRKMFTHVADISLL